VTNVFTFTLVSLAVTVGVFTFSVHLASGTLSLHPSLERFTADRGIDLLLSFLTH
jgi:hypothetical protein